MIVLMKKSTELGHYENKTICLANHQIQIKLSICAILVIACHHMFSVVAA